MKTTTLTPKHFLHLAVLTIAIFISVIIVIAVYFLYTESPIGPPEGLYVRVRPGGYEHNLPCDKLPNVEQVKKVFADHREELLEIERHSSDKVANMDVREYNKNSSYGLGGRFMGIAVSEYSNEKRIYNFSNKICPGKADILINTSKVEDVRYIRAKYEKDFFGIPYRIIVP